MNKSYKYTILTLFLALAFAFGSMAGMNFILRAKERQLLTERGRAIVEAPVRSWQGQDDGEDGETDEEPDNTGYALTTGQIEDILSCWNSRTGVTVHNPVNGQISMEDAIKEGKKWLVEMVIGENGLEDTETYSVSATLGIATQKVSVGAQSEPYYSFWTVQFSSSSMYAVLYLNAVTGKVWGAEITLYEDMPEEIPYERLVHFVELSGLQTSNTNITKNQEGTQAMLKVDDSHIFAEMKFQNIQAYNGKDFMDNNEMLHYEKVRIIYALTIGKEF
jgi:hypothetical protein